MSNYLKMEQRNNTQFQYIYLQIVSLVKNFQKSGKQYIIKSAKIILLNSTISRIYWRIIRYFVEAEYKYHEEEEEQYGFHADRSFTINVFA